VVQENPLRKVAVDLQLQLQVAKVRVSSSNRILSNSNFILENLLKSKGNVSCPSNCTFKIMIPAGSKGSQSQQVKQVLVPARVQPSRPNRASRMADIMANIEEDDDSRAVVSRRRKRQIVESDPEDVFSVPEEIECNPMAPPVTKKRRQLDVEKPPCTTPLLPLQPTAPTQVPPNFQPKPKRCPVPTSQFHLQPTSESRQTRFRPQPKESRPQDKTVATSKLSNPSEIPDEDDPMQEDHKNERKPRWGSNDQDGYLSGWFYSS
jgi:hypothetical protein